MANNIAPEAGRSAMPAEQDNAAAVRRFWDLAWNQGQLPAIDEPVDGDFTNTGIGGRAPQGRSSHAVHPGQVVKGGQMMFLDCPACLDPGGAVRCGLPAEVRCRFAMRSTDGPLESVMITCPAGHCFSGPIESLTWDGKDKHDAGTAGTGSRAGRGRIQDSHDGHDGREGSAPRDFRTEPEISRPSTAPAYFLGHPARLWITVMRPRRRFTRSDRQTWSKTTTTASGTSPTAGEGGSCSPGLPAATTRPAAR
jgi:hypothetical protein